MRKRISSILLAAVLLLTSIPFQVQAEEALYKAELIYDQQGKEVGYDDIVSVQVKLSGLTEAVTQYSAYDLKLSYDSTHLTFLSGTAADSDGNSDTDSDAEITVAHDRIRVKGYGADKSCVDTPVVILRFRVIKPGETNIKLLQAYADLSTNAGNRNAPAVQTDAKTDNITIPAEGYEVVVTGEGITVSGGIYVAIAGEDFKFKLEDYNLYDYSELKVTSDNADITSLIEIDKNTGECTIPGKKIYGTIEITANRTPNVFQVTITGSDVTGEKTAEYNTDYVFKLEREEDFLYTVKVTIGGEEYTGYDLVDDTYTIPGTDITGNIKIKVTKTEDDSNKAEVTFAGAGAKDGSGQKKTLKGVEYPFTIKRKKGYTYSVTVYVEGKRTSYDYDYELDTYYILADNVTGNITIVIGKVPTVEAVEYITLDEQSMFLILYNGIINEGQVPRYDGRSMYWSDSYNAYVWLVTSNVSEKKVKKEAEGKITVTEGTTAGSVNYSGNVNMTLRTDLADAELVLEMYEGKHSLDFMEMQKLLSADIHPDRKVNVRDVMAIQKNIS